MPCQHHHDAALDVIALAEAALRDDQDAMRVILDHCDVRAVASMGASMFATLASVHGNPEHILGKFRQMFTEV
jgi:hypothetical protein